MFYELGLSTPLGMPDRADMLGEQDSWEARFQTILTSQGTHQS